MLQFDLEVVLLGDQLDLLLGEVGSLSLNDQGQELVAQSLFSDREIDQGRLSLDFRWVMGVGQLGLHEQLEVLMQGEVLGPQLQDLSTSLDDETPRDDRHDDGVDLLVHVLDQAGVPVLDGELHVSHDVLGPQPHLFQEVVFFFLSDPGDSL